MVKLTPEDWQAIFKMANSGQFDLNIEVEHTPIPGLDDNGWATFEEGPRMITITLKEKHFDTISAYVNAEKPPEYHRAVKAFRAMRSAKNE